MRKTYSLVKKRSLVNQVIKLMVKMSCRKACEEVGVDDSNFQRWLNAYGGKNLVSTENIKKQYACARYTYMDSLAEEILTIADKAPSKVDSKVDSGDVNHRRLRIDSRKWLLSKLAPKKYGERVQVANDQDNPMPSPTVNINEGNQYYNVVVNNTSKEEQEGINRNLGRIFNRISEDTGL